MRKTSNLVFALFLLAGVSSGCSTHRTTTHEVAYDRRSGEPVAVETHHTTTETTTEEGGVLSSTVNVIGEVIALPFRAVGGLFRAIF
jgi:hypothetical protein